MPALLERPKMTKTMYQALKRHIMRERERKKQAEEEQDAIEEQQRKELEQKKKKEQEDSLTLEQTKEQINDLEKRLERLNQEKHELFSQLKKVLHQEDETRKRAQIKEQSELLSLQQATYPTHGPVSGHPVLIPTGPLTGRPQTSLYRPATSIMAVSVPNVPLKRPRSPSPPPSSVYQHQYGDKGKQGGTLYTHGHQQDFKSGTFQQSAQPSQPAYVSQGVHTIPAAPSAYTVSKSPGKYNPPGQSAFSSYSSHYAQHQPKITEPFPAAYQIQRMQQPGYMASPHAASNIPLQQQLQHANEKAGFNEDKYKIQQQPIRGVTPLAGQQAGLLPHQSLQQAAPGKPSIVTGFSGRSQAPPTSSYQPSSSQASYPVQQPPGSSGRPQYNPQQRFY